MLATIDNEALDESDPALPALRVNVTGCSPNQLGEEVGLAGNTIRRLEEQGASCNASTAKKLADRFGLGVLELFVHDGEDLALATIAGLRQTLYQDKR